MVVQGRHGFAQRGVFAPSMRPPFARAVRARKHRVVLTKAETGSKDKVEKDRIAEVDEMLRELGIDKSTARQVLRFLKKANASDPESLRKLIVKRGANQSAAVAVQLAVDASAAFVAWYSGFNIATSRALGSFTVAAEFLVYTLAMYLSINATLDVFSLITVGLATRKYSTSTVAFLGAVEALAGPDSGFEVLDKARKAVVTVKVLSALEQILDKLKRRAGERANGEANFFRDLGAYLVLLRASESGFDPSKSQLSTSEAANIAAEFAEVDTNDDGSVDLQEFRSLCGRMGLGLTEEEALGAMSILDKNKDGVIDFSEFAAWWVTKGSAHTPASPNI